MGLGKDKTFEHTEFGMSLKRPREDGKLLRTEKRVSFQEDVWASPVSRSRCGLAHCWRRGGVGGEKERVHACALTKEQALRMQAGRNSVSRGAGASRATGRAAVGKVCPGETAQSAVLMLVRVPLMEPRLVDRPHVLHALFGSSGEIEIKIQGST